MKTGIELIAQERKEQIEKHGFNSDEEYDEELKDAALYILTLDRNHYPATWDFWFHDNVKRKQNTLSDHDFYIESLKIAGALIAAEIDRIQNEVPEKE